MQTGVDMPILMGRTSRLRTGIGLENSDSLCESEILERVLMVGSDKMEAFGDEPG